ncbi:MAG TPA: hypothetical protein VK324_03885 [Tepidisphaeraceae bacterium]|nr:hypothetical protein [Tepidisphaeraceae bacterium]
MKTPMSLLLAAALTAAGTIGCDRDERAAVPPPGQPAPATAAPTVAADALPTDLVLASAPAGARGVTDVRESAKPGDRVVVRGVIAGRGEPIAATRAMFTLLDPSVQTCDKSQDDGCKTPWDACCVTGDVIAANVATVQVVDADGRPLKAPLADVGGLAPMKQVTVVGTFRPSPDGKAATIDATGIYSER